MWKLVVPWFGEDILHLPYYITIFTNGSGDTTFNYVQVLIFLILSIALSSIWTLLDRKRINYKKLYYWIRVLVRYYLAYMMMSYGFAKIFNTQFPFPSDLSLSKTYGESSPMHLIWTFMGYSPWYNYFTGGSELLAGILLLFRRTTTYGSLVAITVLSNIVMINFCYDVPVKLFSLHLLLMSIFILSFDLNRVISFFFLNKAIPPADFSISYFNNTLMKTFRVLKYIIICSFIFAVVKSEIDAIKMYNSMLPRHDLKGTYDVEYFTKNNEKIFTTPNNPLKWKKVFIAYSNYLTVRMVNDSLQYLSVEISSSDSTMVFPRPGTVIKDTLHYSQPDINTITLKGVMFNDTLDIQMKKYDRNYLLVNRGFHWINEYPYNR